MLKPVDRASLTFDVVVVVLYIAVRGLDSAAWGRPTAAARRLEGWTVARLRARFHVVAQDARPSDRQENSEREAVGR